MRDCQGTLWAFYRQYEDKTLAPFEGDLSTLELDSLMGYDGQETSALKRQTTAPQLGFAVDQTY